MSVDVVAEEVGEILRAEGRTVAVAESLTGGLVANALARAGRAAEWFRGGVVAYAAEVKHDLLAVPAGPVVAEEAVRTMAESSASLLGADVAVAVTGVGGPDPQDGQPPGTVWMAVAIAGETRTWLHHFDGDPAAVCRQAVLAALDALRDTLRA